MLLSCPVKSSKKGFNYMELWAIHLPPHNLFWKWCWSTSMLRKHSLFLHNWTTAISRNMATTKYCCTRFINGMTCLLVHSRVTHGTVTVRAKCSTCSRLNWAFLKVVSSLIRIASYHLRRHVCNNAATLQHVLNFHVNLQQLCLALAFSFFLVLYLLYPFRHRALIHLSQMHLTNT